MYGWHDLKDKIKRYYGFSKKEIQYLVITILVLAFIVGFDDGSDKFIPAHWFFNYFECMLLVVLSVMVFVSVQRIVALQTGHRPEYKTAWIPLLIGVVLTIISSGKFWYFLPVGVLWVHVLEVHRLGYFRYGLSLYNYGTASIMGPVAAIILAIIFKILLLVSPANPLILKAIYMNVAIAIVNALPIPPLAGSRMFFASRPWYGFILGGIIGAGIFLLIQSLSIWLAIVGAVIFAVAGVVLVYVRFESL